MDVEQELIRVKEEWERLAKESHIPLGRLRAEEVAQVMGRLGREMDEGVVEALVNSLDTEGDGRISLQQFQQAMRVYLESESADLPLPSLDEPAAAALESSHPSSSPSSFLRSSIEPDAYNPMFEQLFASCDLDQDRALNVSERRHLDQLLQEAHLPAEVLQTAREQFDRSMRDDPRGLLRRDVFFTVMQHVSHLLEDYSSPLAASAVSSALFRSEDAYTDRIKALEAELVEARQAEAALSEQLHEARSEAAKALRAAAAAQSLRSECRELESRLAEMQEKAAAAVEAEAKAASRASRAEAERETLALRAESAEREAKSLGQAVEQAAAKSRSSRMQSHVETNSLSRQLEEAVGALKSAEEANARLAAREAELTAANEQLSAHLAAAKVGAQPTVLADDEVSGDRQQWGLLAAVEAARADLMASVGREDVDHAATEDLALGDGAGALAAAVARTVACLAETRMALDSKTRLYESMTAVLREKDLLVRDGAAQLVQAHERVTSLESALQDAVENQKSHSEIGLLEARQQSEEWMAKTGRAEAALAEEVQRRTALEDELSTNRQSLEIEKQKVLSLESAQSVASEEISSLQSKIQFIQQEGISGTSELSSKLKEEVERRTALEEELSTNRQSFEIEKQKVLSLESAQSVASEEISSLQSKIQSLEMSLKQSTQSHVELESTVQQLRQTLDEQGANRAMEAELAQLQKENAEWREKASGLEAQYAALKLQVKESERAEQVQRTLGDLQRSLSQSQQDQVDLSFESNRLRTELESARAAQATAEQQSAEHRQAAARLEAMVQDLAQGATLYKAKWEAAEAALAAAKAAPATPAPVRLPPPPSPRPEPAEVEELEAKWRKVVDEQESDIAELEREVSTLEDQLTQATRLLNSGWRSYFSLCFGAPPSVSVQRSRRRRRNRSSSGINSVPLKPLMNNNPK